MSRSHISPIDSVGGATGEVYAQFKKAAGGVSNIFGPIGAHGLAALKAVLATGSLSRKDQETIKLIVSEAMGCGYGVAAHATLHDTGEPRRDALAAFVDTLVTTRDTIGEADFMAIKAAGYSDRALVEICLAVATAVFTNVFNRIDDTAIDFPPAP